MRRPTKHCCVPSLRSRSSPWSHTSAGRIFAGVVDRVVPPVQAHSLWRHWDEPRIGWYQGAHQRFIRASEGRKVLEETLRAADMLPKETAVS